jgi:predicted RNase H-like HicB family nuclease
MMGMTPAEGKDMQTVKYVHWQEGDAWLGYLQDYPDYWTQGETLDDLIDHLRDLYLELTGGQIPGVRKVGELVVPGSVSISSGRSRGSDVNWCDTAASTTGTATRRPA